MLPFSPRVLPNRAFGAVAGKNATYYGKGCYFAINSSYSIAYSGKNAQGETQMFLCRVLVGEHAKGAKDIPVPPMRLEESMTLYDTTTNFPVPPTMFVTYREYGILRCLAVPMKVSFDSRNIRSSTLRRCTGVPRVPRYLRCALKA